MLARGTREAFCGTSVTAWRVAPRVQERVSSRPSDSPARGTNEAPPPPHPGGNPGLTPSLPLLERNSSRPQPSAAPEGAGRR